MRFRPLDQLGPCKEEEEGLARETELPCPCKSWSLGASPALLPRPTEPMGEGPTHTPSQEAMLSAGWAVLPPPAC